MSSPRQPMTEIGFLVEEDPDGGFSAQALGASIFTQGETMDDLKDAVRDAVRCHFDEEVCGPLRLLSPCT